MKYVKFIKDYLVYKKGFIMPVSDSGSYERLKSLGVVEDVEAPDPKIKKAEEAKKVKDYLNKMQDISEMKNKAAQEKEVKRKAKAKEACKECQGKDEPCEDCNDKK